MYLGVHFRHFGSVDDIDVVGSLLVDFFYFFRELGWDTVGEQNVLLGRKN
jgi:hypothetical protein